MDSYSFISKVAKEKDRESCLSEPVSDLFEDALGNSSCKFSSSTDEEFEHFLLNDGTLDIEQIERSLVPVYSDGLNEINKHKELVRLLSGSFSKSFDIFSSRHSSQFNFCWLTNLDGNFQLSINLLKSEEQSKVILGNLILTACLERALGNLLLLRSKFVPPLLKDLLSHAALCDLVGLPLIVCLKTVIGSPSSLNIRNLLWHGFIFPGEISPKFGFFLIAIIQTIEATLKQKSIIHCSIPSRELTVYQSQQFVDIFPELSSKDLRCMFEVVTRSPVVFSKLSSLWELAIQLFNDGRNGESVISVMYLTENFLRRTYATINNCSDRILSAQSYELYTTFSEILMEQMPNSEKPNNFITYFSISLIEMLFDLLFNQFGLRLRDRFSHGQVKILDFPQQIAKFALCTSYCLIRFIEVKSSSSELYQVTDTLEKVFSEGMQYKSVYHVNGSIVVASKSILANLEQWEIDNVSAPEKQIIVSLMIYLERNAVPTLFRPPEEITLVNHLHHIIRCFQTSVDIYASTFEDYELNDARRKLRERQRNNFLKMKQCRSTMYKSFLEIVYFLVSIHRKIIENHELFETSVKLLLKLLKVIQNLKSAVDDNKWDESLLLTRKVFEQIDFIRTKYGFKSVELSS